MMPWLPPAVLPVVCHVHTATRSRLKQAGSFLASQQQHQQEGTSEPVSIAGDLNFMLLALAAANIY
jgi:hypothetical protein